MRAPMPYRADQGYLDQEESKDQTLEPDRAVANDNGSSTPPKPPAPYQPQPTEGVSAARPAQPVTQQPTFAQMQAAGEARPPMPTESAPDPSAGPTGPAPMPSGAPSLTGPAGDPNAAQNEWTQRAIGNIPGRAVDASGNVFDEGIGGIPLGNVNAGDFNPVAARSAYDAEQARRSNPDTQDWTPEAKARQAAGWNVIPTGNGGFRYELTSNVDPTTVSGVSATADGQQSYGMGKLPPSVFTGLPGQTSTGAPAIAPTPRQPVTTYAGGAPETLTGRPDGIVTTYGGDQNDLSTLAGGSPQGTTQSFDILSQLMKGASGQGAGSEVQNATQQALLEQLKTPSAYGLKEVQDAYGWLGGSIDDQYNLQRQQLAEEMARRGLGASTIYGGRLNDLNIGQRSAKMGMGYDLAQNLAKDKGQARNAAISQGLQGGTTAQNAQLDWLRNLIGYGQQGFENDMRVGEFNQRGDQNWQDFLMKMLGAGYAGG